MFTGKSRKSRPRNENCLLPVENVHVVCFGKLRRRWVYDVIKNKCVKIKGCPRPGNNFQKRLECKSQCVRRRKGKKLGWINFPLQVWNSTPVKKGVCTTSLYNSGVWTCRLVWAQVPVSTYDDDFLHHPSIQCYLEGTVTSGGSAYNTESLVGSTTKTKINYIELNSSVFVRMKRLFFTAMLFFMIHVF